jgi:hypothetical protein
MRSTTYTPRIVSQPLLPARLELLLKLVLTISVVVGAVALRSFVRASYDVIVAGLRPDEPKSSTAQAWESRRAVGPGTHDLPPGMALDATGKIHTTYSVDEAIREIVQSLR